MRDQAISDFCRTLHEPWIWIVHNGLSRTHMCCKCTNISACMDPWVSLRSRHLCGFLCSSIGHKRKRNLFISTHPLTLLLNLWQDNNWVGTFFLERNCCIFNWSYLSLKERAFVQDWKITHTITQLQSHKWSHNSQTGHQASGFCHWKSFMALFYHSLCDTETLNDLTNIKNKSRQTDSILELKLVWHKKKKKFLGPIIQTANGLTSHGLKFRGWFPWTRVWLRREVQERFVSSNRSVRTLNVNQCCWSKYFPGLSTKKMGMFDLSHIIRLVRRVTWFWLWFDAFRSVISNHIQAKPKVWMPCEQICGILEFVQNLFFLKCFLHWRVGKCPITPTPEAIK